LYRMPTPDRKSIERTPWAELVAADDLFLVDEWTRGNHDAFAVLVDRYQRLVFSVAVRIVKDASEAEEVVQIVFLDIFRDLGKFDAARGTLKVWLLQYAYSRSVTRRHHLERRQFYSRVDLDDLKPSDVSTKPISRNTLSSGETARLVEEGLAQLNEKQREAIELIYFQGLKFTEAVAKSGESLPQLRHHYYRGLIKIRNFIESKHSPAEEESEPAPAPTTVRLEVAHVKPRTV
jgi:RNA polymerase sigma-70 factor (ECF subfamily)